MQEPNQELRAARERTPSPNSPGLALSRAELAELAAAEIYRRTGREVALDAHYIAKLERGVIRWPNRTYRQVLRKVLGAATDSALGFHPPQAQCVPVTGSPDHTLPGPPAPAGGGQSGAQHAMNDFLAQTLGEVVTLLGQLGPAGTILHHKMFETWRDEIIRRRALLKLVSLAPLTGLTATDGSQRHVSGPTRETVHDLDRLADSYQALYHSTPPAVLLTPVVAHLETVRDAIRQAASPALRRTLLTNRARVATLAGRLAFFDLRDPMAARGYYSLALEAAQEADDHHLAAAVLGHMAFIPAADHAFAAALDHLRGAEQHVAHDVHGGLSSWLAAIGSEMHTNAGSHSAALASIDRAREALARPGPSGTLPWFDYYDETRLAGFAGYAQLHAGHFDEARRSLAEALERLPPTAVKQRAVFLTDSATVHLSSGDLDEACRVAAKAAEQLHRAGYAIASDRLRQFRAVVDPWRSSLPVRLLDEQLAAIA